MGLITENDVRKMLTDGLLKEKGEFFLSKETILTPSARTYLMDKNIIIREKKRWKEEESETVMEEEKKPSVIVEHNAGFETVFGVHLDVKPEHMTHLRGNLLVFKDHDRIIFRGAIDSLESEIILAQIASEREGRHKLTKDLDEIINFIRKLLQAEITGKEVGSFLLQGLDEAALRDQSYHPSKYFNIRHFLPSYKYGELVAYLNRLRTLTRETEIKAFKAFKNENGAVERVDIVRAFNRLSSLFWIMMFKYLSGQYDESK